MKLDIANGFALVHFTVYAMFNGFLQAAVFSVKMFHQTLVVNLYEDLEDIFQQKQAF